MDKKILKKIIVLLIVLSFILVGGVSIFAQTDKEQEMAELKKELEELEKLEIELLRDSTKTEAEIEALRYRISTIIKNINQLNTEIRQAQSKAQVLTGEIKDREASIEITLGEIDSLRGKLTENLRLLYEEDQKSIIEILISEKDLSGFFNNSLNLEKLSMENRNLLGEIITLKVNLEEEKTSLGVAKNETEQLAQLRAAQAREAEAIRQEQQRLLESTQQKEAAQTRELEEIRRQASEIRARIFELAGMPDDVAAPTFGEAYEIAKWVEGMTGVRPAFLLAILQQESAIGRNVGQCYIADRTSGTSIGINTGRQFSNGIHPTRDLPPFFVIANDLGRDPFKTPVSCPLSFGYGGAMGPAQFIPSTWMMYKARLYSLLGRHANPWSIRDAFLASGVLLTDSGARSQTRDGERRAASIYYSGSSTSTHGLNYANQVLAIADRFQRDIDVLIQSQ